MCLLMCNCLQPQRKAFSGVVSAQEGRRNKKTRVLDESHGTVTL